MQATLDYLYTWYNWPNTFKGAYARQLLDSYPDYPVYATVLYLVMVFYLPGFLRARKLKWELKYPVALWNLFLSVYSAIGAYYTLNICFNGVYRIMPFHQYLCETIPTPDDDLLMAYTKKLHKKQWELEKSQFSTHRADATDMAVLYEQLSAKFYNGPTAFYIATFVYLKTPELLDTLFLILQGKPVSFLHWFHHIVTAIYGWHGSYVMVQSGIVFVTANYTVHAFMYLYYFLVMMGLREKIRPIAPAITAMQCIQMFIGLYVVLYTYFQYWCGPSKAGTLFYELWKPVFTAVHYAQHELVGLFTNRSLTPLGAIPAYKMEEHFYGCDADRTNLRMAAMMFASYCVLFGVLFKELYLDKQVNTRSIVLARRVKEKKEDGDAKTSTTHAQQEDASSACSSGLESSESGCAFAAVPREKGEATGRTTLG